MDDGDVLRWRRGLCRTVRGPRSLQLGVGRGAAVVDGLTDTDWTVIGLLERSPRRADLRAVAGPVPQRADQLVALLVAHGAVVVHRPAGPATPRAERRGRRGPRPWSGPTGAATAVVGGAGLGIVLTVGLAAAGAGTAALVDDATVGGDDVLPGGAQRGDVGRRAAHVAAEAVHRLDPDVRTACPPVPDLVVLVGPHVADAPGAAPLVQSGTAHLPVVVRPDEVLVGPLVVPGSSACLHCLDLHHRDVDPGWPAAVDRLRAGLRRVVAPAPSTAAVVVGLMATLLCSGPLDGGIEVRVGPHGATTFHRWSPHPACGCVGLPDPDPEDPSGPQRRDPPVPSRRAGATMAA
jgi:hypothetical protein